MQLVYETMYILRSSRRGTGRASKASIKPAPGTRRIQMKKRRLAYEINKQRDGIYVQMNYQGPGTLVAPLKGEMRLSEEMRYLTIAGSYRRNARVR